MFLTYLSEHIFIVICAICLAICVGLPLGILAYFKPKIKKIIMWIVDIFQTIPSLAMLGIIMVLAGAGKQTVIIGICLYSLLPIVSNTILGLSLVDSGIKEAARGMGMSKTYRLFRVELPLAFPVIFTGIRIAAVNSVGSAVFAVFVSGGGLGTIVRDAIRISNMPMLLQGTAALMGIAIFLDVTMGFIEKRLSRKNGIIPRKS